jgi:hypothetical protein
LFVVFDSSRRVPAAGKLVRQKPSEAKFLFPDLEVCVTATKSAVAAFRGAAEPAVSQASQPAVSQVS